MSTFPGGACPLNALAFGGRLSKPPLCKTWIRPSYVVDKPQQINYPVDSVMQSSNNRALMYNLSGQVCPQTFFSLEDQRNEPPLTPLRLWYLTSCRFYFRSQPW